jgi:4-amino-4-deoxy-L-arabinose transferase-like glycosyltransferase
MPPAKARDRARSSKGRPPQALPTAGPTRRETAARRILVALLLVLFSAQAVSSLVTKSATWDETNYFGLGNYLLKNRRWDVPSASLHPPLAFYLDSLPLVFSHFDPNVWVHPTSATAAFAFVGAADIARGQTFLSSAENRGDRLLTLSRLMVVLQALVLGYFVYRFSTTIYGWRSGLLALLFFAFCPNMLAHAGLITPDMTLTACFFITVYYFRMALVGNERRYFLYAGLALGLALLSKFTAVMLLPIEGAMVACVLARRGRIRVSWLLLSLASALLVFLVGYDFNVTPYIQGVLFQQVHAVEGHLGFLMGQLSAQGWWYYCLVAFVLKTPIPMLIFLALALFLLGVHVVRRAVPLDEIFLWIPIAAVFVFFSVEVRSIGLRYVLPVYPFIFVLASGAVMSLKRLRYVLIVPVIWYVVGTVAIRPDYLAYFNELIGGPDNGYRYLVDSNLDWGQDLKGLKTFMDSHGIQRIYLSYFGTDSPDRYGIQYDWLPSFYLKNPAPQQTIGVARQRYLAISVTNLQGVYMDPPTMYRWLDRYTPIARIGHSIFVYYLE